MTSRIPLVAITTFLLLSPLCSAELLALKRIANAPAAAGTVNLPYYSNGKDGSVWMIYHNGWLQQQGNRPVYSQGAQLTINGVQPSMNNNAARIDEETKELVLETMNVQNNLSVTRRVFFDNDLGFVRIIDVIRNAQAQDQVANVSIQTQTNYGVQASQLIEDPKNPDLKLGWVAQTGAGICVLEMFAGKGSKLVPQLQTPQGNNYIQARYDVTVPAGKEVALIHLHGTIGSIDQGKKMLLELKETDLLSTLPKDLRKSIINFGAAKQLIGDYELLRGEVFDVVELRSGDVMQGTLRETSYKLTTFYGPVELPVDRVIGLISVGQFKPRQLLITVDGEIFGGTLDKPTIDLELTSGQLVSLPATQVSRMGYRKRADEPEEWSFNRPYVLMRSGERIGVQPPAEPVSVTTRYGTLQLDPKSIGSIAFQSDSHALHDLYLADGSKLAGIVNVAALTMKLSSADQTVTFAPNDISRLYLAGNPEGDLPNSTPRLLLSNQDVMVGTLGGELKLQTAFNTLAVNGQEVRTLNCPMPGSLDVQLTLWDQTTVSGQLQAPTVQCQTQTGVTIEVPVSLIQEYHQPQPTPSAAVVERIKSVAADLNADDWKHRDRAEAQLVSMGIIVIPVLEQLRDSQPPEAQQRIDAILRQLSTTEKPKPVGAAPIPPPALQAIICG